MSRAFPEMLPNTVIETSTGKLVCINWATDDRLYGYWFALDDTSRKLVLIGEEYLTLEELNSNMVRRIYGSGNIHDGAREPLRMSILKAILNEHTTQYLLWDCFDAPEETLSKTSELPEIKPGMVLRTDTGYFLVVPVDGADLTAYRSTHGRNPQHPGVKRENK